jgi:type III pantothenate kinase
MNLVIDIGNSRVKLFLFKNDKITFRSLCNHNEFIKTLQTLPFREEIINVISSTVSVNYDDIIELNFKNSNYFKLSNKNLKLPFQNNYKTLNSLGQDRLALVSSAVSSYPQTNTLIIDIGTCITYDFIDSKNIYHGGAISPGFNLRYSSLNDHTSNLPLLEFKEIDRLIGSNTEDSIHSGIYNGIIAEINYHIEKLFIDYNDLNVVITGGSSKFLLNRIKNAIFADQDFIAVGLNYIINYNENR